MEKDRGLHIGRLQCKSSYPDFCFDWIIDDISTLYRNKYEIFFSHTFWYNRAWWKLFFRPNVPGRMGWAYLGLSKIDSTISNQRLHYEFTIGELKGSCEGHTYYKRVYQSCVLYSEACLRVCKPGKNTSSNGDLTISCILRTLKNFMFEEISHPKVSQMRDASTETVEGYCMSESGKSIETATGSLSSGEHRLAQNLRNLLSSGDESDIILNVQERKFKCHRAILSSRSSVFSTMLKHDMKEKNSGEVFIRDCHPEAFDLFLEHLYSGSIKTLSGDRVFELYKIADKYNVSDLEQECTDFLSGNLSVETFCDVARLSLKYNKSELLEKAIEFFAKNVCKICRSVQWQVFLKENPVEANEFNLKALEYHGIND